MNILDFYTMKQKGNKITVSTCYDYTSARLLAQTSLDCLLVGDSVAMVMHGFKNTLSATMDMMRLHTEAVSRGAGDQFIVTDLPFLSYRKSLSETVSAAEVLIRAGAHAVKLEAVTGHLNSIKHLVESGIPVMGHLGLTPQYIHTLGGYHFQGKTRESAEYLKQDALKLQEAGCFALVLECVPEELATEVTQLLTIPTIGIGAGPFTDGQVLVMQDLLGLNIDFKPKFVKTFMEGEKQIKKGIEAYVNAVKSGEFPSHEHAYRHQRLVEDSVVI